MSPASSTATVMSKVPPASLAMVVTDCPPCSSCAVAVHGRPARTCSSTAARSSADAASSITCARRSPVPWTGTASSALTVSSSHCACWPTAEPGRITGSATGVDVAGSAGDAAHAVVRAVTAAIARAIAVRARRDGRVGRSGDAGMRPSDRNGAARASPRRGNRPGGPVGRVVPGSDQPRGSTRLWPASRPETTFVSMPIAPSPVPIVCSRIWSNAQFSGILTPRFAPQPVDMSAT